MGDYKKKKINPPRHTRLFSRDKSSHLNGGKIETNTHALNSLWVRGIHAAVTNVRGKGAVRARIFKSWKAAGLREFWKEFHFHFLPCSLLHPADGESTKSSSSGLFRFFDICSPARVCPPAQLTSAGLRGTPSAGRIHDT